VICPDARTPDPSGKGYPEGSDVGQFGWDVGMTFSSLAQLESKLKTAIAENGGNKVERLAIDVHGAPGYIDIDGKIGSGALSIFNDPKLTFDAKSALMKTKMFGAETFASYKPQFLPIAGVLVQGATLLFMSCNMGSGQLGSDILKKLSGEIFRGVKVVAFIRVGVSGQIAVKSCMLPGMKVTEGTEESSSPEEAQRRWLSVKGDPWASENSAGAKVALNGAITKDPDPPPAATDYSPDAYLPGTWSVTIGDWRGYFMFDKAPLRSASWQDETPTKRHPGKWWAKDGSVYWSFDDDQPGWQRIFEVTGTLKSTVEGGAKIKGVPHGFFTMSKQV